MKNDENNHSKRKSKIISVNEKLTLFDDPNLIEKNLENKTEKKISSQAKNRKYKINSKSMNKRSSLKPLKIKKDNCYQKTLKILHDVFEHIVMQIFIILLSMFSLFNDDIKILALPKTVDYPFHHVNEFIFFFFFTEFMVFILSQKNFVGSFYFYLDIVSLLSLIPEVHIIWDPIISLFEDDGSSGKIEQVLSNSHLAKASRASQAGSKASKYLRLLKLINFIKVVRVAKVVAHTSQIEKQFEKKQYKIGIDTNTGTAQSLRKKKGIRLKNSLNYNEIAIFLKYQKSPIKSFKTTLHPKNKNQYLLAKESLKKNDLPRLSILKNNLDNIDKSDKRNFLKKTKSVPLNYFKAIEKVSAEEKLNDSFHLKKRNFDNQSFEKDSPKNTSERELNHHLNEELQIRQNPAEIKLDFQEDLEIELRINDMNKSNANDNNFQLQLNNEDYKCETNKGTINKKGSIFKFNSSERFLLNDSENPEIENKNTNNNNIKFKIVDDVIQENNLSVLTYEHDFEKSKDFLCKENDKTLSVLTYKSHQENSEKDNDDNHVKSHFKNLRVDNKTKKGEMRELKSNKKVKIENLNDLSKNSIEIFNKEFQTLHEENNDKIEKEFEFINAQNLKKSRSNIEPVNGSNTSNQKNTLNKLSLHYTPELKNLIPNKPEHNEVNFNFNTESSNKNESNEKINYSFNANNYIVNRYINGSVSRQSSNSNSNINFKSKNNIQNKSIRSISHASSIQDDIMNEEEENKVNEKVKSFQSRMYMIKKQIEHENSHKTQSKNPQEENIIEMENRGTLKADNLIGDNNIDVNQNRNNNLEDNIENEEDQTYLKDIENKANLKLDKKLTQKFTNRVILIIMVLLVALPIIDIDFIFDLVYSREEQPDYKYFCLDLLYLSMNLTLSNPKKYFPFFTSTLESCFYGYGYLKNYTADRNLILKFPDELEFFMQLNFTDIDIFSNFNNLTKFFNKDYIELEGFQNYKKKLRIEYDYSQEYYYLDYDSKFSFFTCHVTLSFFNSVLSILKSLFVAVLLVFGTFIFTKDISFFVISPLEKLFTKLEIIFNSLDSIYENINLLNEDIENEKNKKINKIGKKQKQKNNLSDRSYSKDKKEDNSKDEKKAKFDNKKSQTNLELFTEDNYADDESTKDNNYYKKGSNNTSIKGKKFHLEIDRVDFSIMKLLNLISMSLGNQMLMTIPNCDLSKDLVINLKSPSVSFEGFILMIDFNNKDNLIQKLGKKSIKYFNKTISLFHAIGLIFCGQPYKIDDMDFILWRKDKNSYLRNMFKYIHGLNKQKDSLNSPFKIDSNILNKVLLKEDLNMFLSDMGGNICCLTGIKFINFLLKQLRKTMSIFSEANVGMNLFCNFGRFYHGYCGSLRKMNEVIFGEPIHNLKIIKEKTKSINPNYPSLFLDEKILDFLAEDLKKNIILYDLIETDENKKTYTKLYRHYINYQIINNNLESPLTRSITPLKDSLNRSKLNKRFIFKENKEFIEKLKFEKYNFKFTISVDNVYLELTSDFNPIYKNLMNLALNAFLENDFEKSRNIFEDISKLIKSTNDANDLVFNAKINEWLKYIRKNQPKNAKNNDNANNINGIININSNTNKRNLNRYQTSIFY